MPDYNFLNLSPEEFEILTRDLLQKKLGVTLESFSSGRDRGIDLRYSKNRGKTIIVQCKRHSTYNGLLHELRSEIIKVKKLNPKRYILSTSIGLTPDKKNRILKLFKSYIKSYEDIIGKEDLNNLLNLYPEVEKNHIKLWLSSTNILTHIMDKIINNKIYNQSNFERENIKDEIKIYVENKSFNEAMKIIGDNKFVIISGIPGIGKTTLARILVYYFLAKKKFDDFIFLSNDIKEGFQVFRSNHKQLFFFDDFLGTNFLVTQFSTNIDHMIVQFIRKIKKSRNKILILTTREYILNQAKMKYELFNSEPDLEFAKCIIDLSKYTRLVRAKILYNHLYFSKLPSNYIENLLKDNNYFNIIEHHNYNPRIIEAITKEAKLKRIKSDKFYETFISYLDNPTGIWEHAFNNQISTFARWILMILLISETPITLEDFKTEIDKFIIINNNKNNVNSSMLDFDKSLKELENTFITIGIDHITTSQIIEFQNPSIKDFLRLYLGKNSNYIKDLIAGAVFFNQLFTAFTLDSSDTAKICLNEEDTKVIESKIIEEFDSLQNSRYVMKASSLDNDLSKYLTLDNYQEGISYKLKTLAGEFNLKRFPKIKELIKNKFVRIDINKLSNTDELKNYLDTLAIIKEYIEIDKHHLIANLHDSVSTVQGLVVLSKLKSIYPDEYTLYMGKEESKEKIKKIVQEEIDDRSVKSRDTLDDLLNDMNELEEEVNIPGIMYLKKELENLVEEESQAEFEENISDIAQDAYRTRNKPKTENKSKERTEISNIINMFDTLRKS